MKSSTLIFVYGTLRKSSEHPKAKYLRDRARFIGQATTCARLYDLGPYPGILPPQQATDTVHGDLFEMNNPAELLGVLDEYEDAAAGNKQLFRREITNVQLVDGQMHEAWVYCYTGDISKARRIDTGEW